jgi:transposase
MIEPRLPRRRRLGRPPKIEIRSVVNPLLYLMRTGCHWRQLPREFPPYTTVRHYFYACHDGGVLEPINFELLLKPAKRSAESPAPRLVLSTVNRSRPLRPAARAASMRQRRSRAANVISSLDTTGMLLGVEVHPADLQDRDGAPLVIAAIHDLFPWLRRLFAKFGSWTIEIMRRMADTVSFEVLPRRWVVERTLAWLNRNRRLAKDFGATIASASSIWPRSSLSLADWRRFDTTYAILSRTVRDLATRPPFRTSYKSTKNMGRLSHG